MIFNFQTNLSHSVIIWFFENSAPVRLFWEQMSRTTIALEGGLHVTEQPNHWWCISFINVMSSVQCYRWSITRVEYRGQSPPLPYWPPLLWCSLEYCWPSELQVPAAGWCPAFHPQEPPSPSLGLPSMSSSLTLYACLGFLQLKLNALCLVLLKLIWFIWAHFSHLSRSLWMTSLSSVVSTSPLSWVSNLLNPTVCGIDKDAERDQPPVRHKAIDSNWFFIHWIVHISPI